MKDFAIQLWTLDNETTADFKGTLKNVSQYGYTGVEFAGFKNVEAVEMKKYLDDFGLTAVGAHVSASDLSKRLKQTLEYNSVIENKYIIVPAYKFDGEDSVKTLAELLKFSSEKAKDYGIKVGFHNHAAEFEKINGKYILDIIADQTSDDVIIEPDVYWIRYSGVDPCEYVEKLGKKAELIHLKQIGADCKEETLLSDGIIDMAKIIDTAKYSKNFIVEYEGEIDRLTASKYAADFLKTIR